MADSWPPTLKGIAKYLARGREAELEGALVVAYYCNIYAVKMAVAHGQKGDQKAKQFMTGLLEKCEALRSMIEPDHDGEHYKEVEQYALNVFNSADADLHAGNASHATARKFFEAMCFLDVLQVFGGLSDRIVERRDNAKILAAQIARAIREGHTVTPPAINMDGDTPSSAQDTAASQTAPHAPESAPVSDTSPTQGHAPAAYPPAIFQDPPSLPSLDISDAPGSLDKPMQALSADQVSPPQHLSPPTRPVPAKPTSTSVHLSAPTPSPSAGYNPSPKNIADAKKAMKNAQSAVDFEGGIPRAIHFLEQALELLKTS